MSWLQGVVPREDLPERFVAWADGLKPGERLEYITWFDDDRSQVFMDYGVAGGLKLSLKEAA